MELERTWYHDALVAVNGLPILAENVRGDKNVQGVVYSALDILLLLSNERLKFVRPVSKLPYRIRLLGDLLNQHISHLLIRHRPIPVDDIAYLEAENTEPTEAPGVL